MIEYDESEMMYSDLTDETLQFIADYYGSEVKDKLLYRVMNDVGDTPISML